MFPLGPLSTQGFINVEYPRATKVAVARAMDSWMRFCTLPQDVKDSFLYVNDDNFDGSGYERKVKAGTTTDEKENFHVTLNAHTRLAETSSRIDIASRVFIMNANQVIRLITPLVLEFANSVEQQFGLKGLSEEVEAGSKYWFLRWLHYFGDQPEGEAIAAPHVDKSGFTLHLFESHSGLQYLELLPTGNAEAMQTSTRTWHEMPVKDGQTVIIPNVQLQYRTEGRLTALCHRVVATKETSKVGRFSAVCFIPFMQSPQFNKDKGRQQDFLPGYNYDMHPAEFAQFFREPALAAV